MTDKNLLAQIDKEFNNRYPNRVIYDGIADFVAFRNTSPRILWVLKESNDPGQTSWHIREFMRTGVKEYPRWKCVWGIPVIISHALINDVKSFSEIPPEDDIERVLQKVAAINVKKIGGTSQADQKVINAHYKIDKDLLLKQIEAISPDIIINCSRVWDLFLDLKKTVGFKYIEPFQVAKSKYGPVINAYHPNRRNLTKEKYFELIQKCLESVSL